MIFICLLENVGEKGKVVARKHKANALWAAV